MASDADLRKMHTQDKPEQAGDTVKPVQNDPKCTCQTSMATERDHLTFAIFGHKERCELVPAGWPHVMRRKLNHLASAQAELANVKLKFNSQTEWLCKQEAELAAMRRKAGPKPDNKCHSCGHNVPNLCPACAVGALSVGETATINITPPPAETDFIRLVTADDYAALMRLAKATLAVDAAWRAPYDIGDDTIHLANSLKSSVDALPPNLRTLIYGAQAMTEEELNAARIRNEALDEAAKALRSKGVCSCVHTSSENVLNPWPYKRHLTDCQFYHFADAADVIESIKTKDTP